MHYKWDRYTDISSLFLRASVQYFSLQIILHPRASAIVTYGVRLATRTGVFLLSSFIARSTVASGIKYDLERLRGIIKNFIFSDEVFYLISWERKWLWILRLFLPIIYLCFIGETRFFLSFHLYLLNLWLTHRKEYTEINDKTCQWSSSQNIFFWFHNQCNNWKEEIESHLWF